MINEHGPRAVNFVPTNIRFDNQRTWLGSRKFCTNIRFVDQQMWLWSPIHQHALDQHHVPNPFPNDYTYRNQNRDLWKKGKAAFALQLFTNGSKMKMKKKEIFISLSVFSFFL